MAYMKNITEVKGTLPGDTPEAAVKRKRRIGVRKPLPVSIEADLLFTGLSREEAKNMSPKQLAELADVKAQTSELLLGC